MSVWSNPQVKQSREKKDTQTPKKQEDAKDTQEDSSNDILEKGTGAKGQEAEKQQDQGKGKPGPAAPEWLKGLEEKKNITETIYHMFSKESPTNFLQFCKTSAAAEGAQKSMGNKLAYVNQCKNDAEKFSKAMKKDKKATAEQKTEGQVHYEQCVRYCNICTELHDVLNKPLEKHKRKLKICEKFQVAKEKREPMVQLIATVKAVDSKAIAATKKDYRGAVGEANEVYDDYIMTGADIGFDAYGQAADIIDIKKGEVYDPFEKDTPDGLADQLVDAGQETISWINQVKDLCLLVWDVYTAFKEYKKMSTQNKIDKIIDLVTRGIAWGGDLIGQFFSSIPGVGTIIGLIKNIFACFVYVKDTISAGLRRSALSEKKEALEQKMARQKNKARMAGLDLYSFMDKKGVLDEKAMGRRETRKEPEQKGKPQMTSKMQMDNLRKKHRENKEKNNDEAASREYYKAKEQELILQYDAINEAIYKNQKSQRDQVLGIGHEVADVAANIAALFPGYGSAVSGGIKIVNGVAKLGEKVFKKAYGAVHNREGALRADSTKMNIRNKYAKDIYAHMRYVAFETDTEGNIDIANKSDSQLNDIAKNYAHAEDMLKGTNAYFPKLIDSNSRGELISKISKSFANGG